MLEAKFNILRGNNVDDEYLTGMCSNINQINHVCMTRPGVRLI